MALTAGSIATSADIIDFKNKIKAEMQRRQYGTGSLNVAANTGNFSVTAGVGQLIKAAHYTETIGLLNKITSQSITGGQGIQIKALNGAYDRLVNTYSKRGRHATSSDCSGSVCTGLCAGTCTGSCTNACGTTCNNGCNATCSGVNSMCNSCATGCMSGCISYCYTSSYSAT